MSSISTTGAPSITGYTLSQIEDEISTNLTARNTAKSAADTAFADWATKVNAAMAQATVVTNARTTYTNNPTTANLNALNSAISTLNTLRQQAVTSGGNLKTKFNSLMTAMTAYIDSLARQQIFLDTKLNDQLNSQVASLAGKTSQPPFQGFTDAELTEIQSLNAARATSRNALITAFNEFRFLEWSINDHRRAILNLGIDRDLAYLLYVQTGSSSDLSAYNNALSTYNFFQNHVDTVLLPDRTNNKWPALQTALNNFTGPISAVLTKIKSAFTDTSTFAQGWSGYIEGLAQQVRNNVQIAYDAQVTSDQAALSSHYAEWTAENANFTNTEVSLSEAFAAARLNTLLNAGQGSLEFGAAASTPSLSPPSTGLSMSALMRIISAVQLMISRLSQLVNDSDSKINSFRRELQHTQLNNYLLRRQALDVWAQRLYDADVSYNQRVYLEAQNSYAEIRTKYEAFNSQIPAINSLIQSNVNPAIDAFNQSQVLLKESYNNSQNNLQDSYNLNLYHRPDVTNQLDFFFNFDNPDFPAPSPSSLLTADQVFGDLNIQHFQVMDGLSPVPDADYLGNPPTFLTQSQIDALNANIAIINDKVAALRTFPSMASLIGADPIPKLYVRQPSDLRALFFTSADIVTISFLAAFATTLDKMALGELYKRLETEVGNDTIAKLFRTIGVSFKQTTSAPQQTTQTSTVGGAFGLAATDTEASAAKISSFIAAFGISENFKRAMEQLLTRVGVSVGVQSAAAPQPARAKSTFGLQPDEISSEDLVALDGETNRTIATNSLRELLVAAGDTTALAGNAVDALEGVLNNDPELAKVFGGLSEEEIQQILALIAALQKILLLLLAAVSATGAGISFDELLAEGSGAIDTQKEQFIALGLDPQSAELLARGLGKLGIDLRALLQAGGLSQETITALLFLFGSSAIGIRGSRLLEGGEAEFELLLRKLKAIGITFEATLNNIEFARELIDFFLQKIAIIKDDIARYERNRAEVDRLENRLNDLLRQLRNESGARIETRAAEQAGQQFQQIAQEVVNTLNRLNQRDDTAAIDRSTPQTISQEPISRPSATSLIDRYKEELNKVPAPLRERLIAEASKAPKETQKIGVESLAALYLALELRAISFNQAGLLLKLGLIEKGLDTSGLTTDIARRLFQRTPIEIEQLLADIKKSEATSQGLRQEILKNAAIPLDIRTLFKERYQESLGRIEENKYVNKVFELFAKSVDRLSNFNDLFLRFLIDPARSIVRDFSIISRTSTDKRNQPTTFIGG